MGAATRLQVAPCPAGGVEIKAANLVKSTGEIQRPRDRHRAVLPRRERDGLADAHIDGGRSRGDPG